MYTYGTYPICFPLKNIRKKITEYFRFLRCGKFHFVIVPPIGSAAPTCTLIFRSTFANASSKRCPSISMRFDAIAMQRVLGNRTYEYILVYT